MQLIFTKMFNKMFNTSIVHCNSKGLLSDPKKLSKEEKSTLFYLDPAQIIKQPSILYEEDLNKNVVYLILYSLIESRYQDESIQYPVQGMTSFDPLHPNLYVDMQHKDYVSLQRDINVIAYTARHIMELLLSASHPTTKKIKLDLSDIKIMLDSDHSQGKHYKAIKDQLQVEINALMKANNNYQAPNDTKYPESLQQLVATAQKIYKSLNELMVYILLDKGSNVVTKGGLSKTSPQEHTILTGSAESLYEQYSKYSKNNLLIAANNVIFGRLKQIDAIETQLNTKYTKELYIGKSMGKQYDKKEFYDKLTASDFVNIINKTGEKDILISTNILDFISKKTIADTDIKSLEIKNHTPKMLDLQALSYKLKDLVNAYDKIKDTEINATQMKVDSINLINNMSRKIIEMINHICENHKDIAKKHTIVVSEKEDHSNMKKWLKDEDQAKLMIDVIGQALRDDDDKSKMCPGIHTQIGSKTSLILTVYALRKFMLSNKPVLDLLQTDKDKINLFISTIIANSLTSNVIMSKNIPDVISKINEVEEKCHKDSANITKELSKNAQEITDALKIIRSNNIALRKKLNNLADMRIGLSDLNIVSCTHSQETVKCQIIDDLTQFAGHAPNTQISVTSMDRTTLSIINLLQDFATYLSTYKTRIIGTIQKGDQVVRAGYYIAKITDDKYNQYYKYGKYNPYYTSQDIDLEKGLKYAVVSLMELNTTFRKLSSIQDANKSIADNINRIKHATNLLSLISTLKSEQDVKNQPKEKEYLNFVGFATTYTSNNYVSNMNDMINGLSHFKYDYSEVANTKDQVAARIGVASRNLRSALHASIDKTAISAPTAVIIYSKYNKDIQEYKAEDKIQVGYLADQMRLDRLVVMPSIIEDRLIKTFKDTDTRMSTHGNNSKAIYEASDALYKQSHILKLQPNIGLDGPVLPLQRIQSKPDMTHRIMYYTNDIEKNHGFNGVQYGLFGKDRPTLGSNPNIVMAFIGKFCGQGSSKRNTIDKAKQEDVPMPKLAANTNQATSATKYVVDNIAEKKE